MIFASRRSDQGPDPHLESKVWIFFIGAALALLGIGMESRWLTGLAILVLAGGVMLRFLSGGESTGEEEAFRETLGDEDGPPPFPDDSPGP